MTIGKRIQMTRKAAGLSQKELGKRLGVSGSMIGQYENDLRKPKRETLEKISIALNVSWKELAGEKVFEYAYGAKWTRLLDRTADELTPREAIHTLLKQLYGRFESRLIETPDGDVEAVYYLVGEGDNEFFLLGNSMTDILEFVLKFLAVVVEPMKLTGSEDAIKTAYQAALAQTANQKRGQGLNYGLDQETDH